jgi:osmotically-inducible protein OsmY
MKRTKWTLMAGVALALAAAGCDDTLRGVQKDTKENTEAAKRAAEESGLDEAAQKAAEKAKEAGVVVKRKAEEIAADLRDDDDGKRTAAVPARENDDDLGESAGKAKSKLEEAGREIGSEIKATAILADVKQALVRDETVDASNIDVDVDDDARTVILRGSVPTAAQKTKAEAVARTRAKDYTVHNKLALRPVAR